MNSFLELYTSSDYALTEREYHTSTWEYINTPSDVVIPFQWTGASDFDFEITKIAVDGTETSITGKFWNSSIKASTWTETTSGTWTIDGPTIASSAPDVDDFITSNTFTLTAGKGFWIYVDTASFTTLSHWEIRLEKNGSPVATQTDFTGWDGNLYYNTPTTGADYTIVLENTGGSGTITTMIILNYESRILYSGSYYWYDGGALTAAGGYFTDIYRLRIDHGAYTYFSDWCDPCGVSGLAKIAISSSYDYGGVKYATGYSQWMYKRATVRRDPKAEIEEIADTLNGKRMREKITTAVRYTMRMKCTEAEFEALVHGMAGTLVITDSDGQVYDPQNVELGDPTMYRTNGIVELSFIDGNNINVWSRNNSTI